MYTWTPPVGVKRTAVDAMKESLLRAIAHALVYAGKYVGYGRAGRAASGLAGLLGYAPRLDSTAVRRNLSMLFPGAGEEWLETRGRHLQTNALRAKLFDKFILPHMTSPELDATSEWIGDEKFFETLDSGRGVVIVSLHYGRYWAVPILLSRRGAKVFVFQASKGRLPAKELTVSGGTLDANDLSAPLRAVRALRAGGVVCLHLDAIGSRNPVAVDFLGHKTNFAPSPVQLAESGNALVVPMLAVGDGNGRIQIHAYDAIDPANSTLPLEELMQQLAAPLERQVREDPGQWYGIANAHRRIVAEAE